MPGKLDFYLSKQRKDRRLAVSGLFLQAKSIDVSGLSLFARLSYKNTRATHTQSHTLSHAVGPIRWNPSHVREYVLSVCVALSLFPELYGPNLVWFGFG